MHPGAGQAGGVGAPINLMARAQSLMPMHMARPAVVQFDECEEDEETLVVSLWHQVGGMLLVFK